jgi:hypothetical protein
VQRGSVEIAVGQWLIAIFGVQPLIQAMRAA